MKPGTILGHFQNVSHFNVPACGSVALFLYFHPFVWEGIKLLIVLYKVISCVTTNNPNHREREMEMKRRDTQREKEFKRHILGEIEMKKQKRNLDYLITTTPSTTWSMEVLGTIYM